ncbi:hypothetical protein POJ06DRAFT_240002 [Lipomyces tetrasporus]|uniref:Uncharacterized protein n=1 Tax=Lipomyces tetrasporus TaxID=54092 RepID=A0AAD7QNI5_9ASCO|nr:uncharacterized protein POJ06DRAFT_240002 [Lipomyces tetrasporus]KAJ8098280.1 hypothetical protein POJ06DRAFT_240002 [Lipomyces tetrasporus]
MSHLVSTTSSPMSSGTPSPCVSPTGSFVQTPDTPISALGSSAALLPRKTVTVFVPAETRLPVDLLGDTVSTFSLPTYKLHGYTTFKPKFAPTNLCIVLSSSSPDNDDNGDAVTGRLVFVPEDKISLYDTYEDEGRTKARVSCSVSSGDTARVETVDVYLWNGNSLVGEWEYL